MTIIRPLLLTTGILFSASSMAREINVPVPLNYGLIRSVLVQKLFTNEGQTARVWKDGKQCSFVDLSNPQIGASDDLVKIDNNVHARIGTKLGGKCMALVEWKGILETFQKPTLEKSGNVLSFPVTRTNAYDSNGQALNINQLQDLLQKAAAPKLAEFKLDLDKSRADIVKTLLPYVDAKDSEQLHDTVNSLRFNKIKVDDKAIVVNLGFTSDHLKPAEKKPQAAFDANELQQWQAVWQGWQASLDKTISQAPLEGDMADSRETLHDILQQAGAAFEQGLTGEFVEENDPVRSFLNKSWDDLAPLLRSASKQFPGAESLRYLTLIAATDLIYELESIGSPLGLEISANGLRKIARNYINHQSPHH